MPESAGGGQKAAVAGAEAPAAAPAPRRYKARTDFLVNYDRSLVQFHAGQVIDNERLGHFCYETGAPVEAIED